jgi:MFS family permease
MYGARALAANIMLRPSPPRREPPPDRYASTYHYPEPPAANDLTERLPLRKISRADTATWAIAAAAFIGLIASFSMHLINLRMQNLGFAGAAISFSVALQALAICASALAARRMIANVGLRHTLPISSILCAIALVGIFFNMDIYVINALRIVFSIGLTFLLIASEYLVTVRGGESNRGRVIAWYTTALGAGAISGPLLVSIMGIKESGSFLIGAAMLLFGSVALSHCLSADEGKTTRHDAPFGAIAFMPAIFLAAFVFGIADNGGLSMLPVYAALNGYESASAANLAVFAALGAAVLQFPIGWLATKRSMNELLATFGVCALCLSAFLPLVIGNMVLAGLVAAGLGGVVEGLYTVALIGISRDRRVQSLSMLNACFISVCSFGEVVGPAASSISMEFLGPHGLVVALVLAFAVYALAMMNLTGLKAQHR